MHKPIKRVWVPPSLAPAAPVASAQPLPDAPAQRKQIFIDVPETDIEEKNSDSVWAEFASVQARLPAPR